MLRLSVTSIKALFLERYDIKIAASKRLAMEAAIMIFDYFLKIEEVEEIHDCNAARVAHLFGFANDGTTLADIAILLNLSHDGTLYADIAICLDTANDGAFLANVAVLLDSALDAAFHANVTIFLKAADDRAADADVAVVLNLTDYRAALPECIGIDTEVYT